MNCTFIFVTLMYMNLCVIFRQMFEVNSVVSVKMATFT